MGLSVAISGGIVLTVIMLILLSMPGIVDKMFSIGDVTSQVAHFEKTISDTDISLETLFASTTPRVNFTLNNDDTEKLWNFDDFDVIIEYESASGDQLEELSFGAKCQGVVPTAGEWCIEGISGDFLDEGILNDGESAEIWTQVSQSLVSGNVRVTVGTDNGEVAMLPAPKRSWHDASPVPPATCEFSVYGRTFVDTDTGVSYVCDPTRDKWLSLEMMVLFGEESSDCDPGENPNTEKNCAVEWGNGVGTDSDTPGMGLYIPYNATLVGYGVSIDNNDCGGGTYDFEVWGTASNTVDEPYVLQAEVTGLSGEANNANNLNLDIGVNQYIMWGLENNCGGVTIINDFNAIIYLKWKHDNP